MIITKPELIKLNEKSFIESLIENLDWKTLEKLVQNKLHISDISCKDGDIIVHNNSVAYKLNLELKLDVDVIFDREGEFIGDDVIDKKEEEDLPDYEVLETELLDDEILNMDSGLEDELILDEDIVLEDEIKDEDLLPEGSALDIDDILKND